MRYSCFGLDLDPDILPGPLHPLNERRLPISLFSCLFWYLLSRRIAFALFGTQSFPLALFAPLTLFSLLLIFPSFLIFCYHAASSLHLWTSSFAMYLSFRILLRSLPQSSSRRPCSSLPLKEGQLLELCFLPFLIFIIIPRIVVPAFSSFIVRAVFPMVVEFLSVFHSAWLLISSLYLSSTMFDFSYLSIKYSRRSWWS